jgi:hypothetical protein
MPSYATRVHSAESTSCRANGVPGGVDNVQRTPPPLMIARRREGPVLRARALHALWTPPRPRDDLARLSKPEDHSRRCDAPQPVRRAQRDHPERPLQRRHVQHQHLEYERQHDRRPQPAIREEMRRRRSARPTMVAKLSSASTMSAASFDTLVPIATPMSAVLSASALRVTSWGALAMALSALVGRAFGTVV